MKLGKSIEPIGSRLNAVNFIPWAILTGLIILYPLILYPSLVVTDDLNYQVGDVARRDIKSDSDFFLENIQATQAARKNAADQVLTVYDHDVKMASRTKGQVLSAFAAMREDLKAMADVPTGDEKAHTTEKSIGAISPREIPADQIRKLKSDFESKIGIPVSDSQFQVLLKERFSPEIAGHITTLLAKILDNGVVTNKDILLKESEKGILLRTVGSDTESIVTQLKSFYGHDQAKTMVTVFGETLLKDVGSPVKSLVVDMTQRLIQPNITLNRRETEERRKQAAGAVEPTLYRIKAGEMLLREGERVTELQLRKLKAFQERSQKERLLGTSFGAAMMILCFLLTLYFPIVQHQRAFRRYLNRNLLFTSAMLVLFLFIAKVSAVLIDSMAKDYPVELSPITLYFGMPLAAASMAVCLFLGMEVAVPFAMVLSISVAVLLQNRLDLFIYFFLSSVLGAYWIRRCRERKVFIKAGFKLGLLNILLVTAIDVYAGTFSGAEVLWNWGFALQAGIVAGMITTGIAPLIELAFGFTTDITLLELANFEQPLLRRLMIEAPGTYHHSVIVGSLVEAAAADIGANPLLAKVCGYYHDIGKLKQPLYFIENQMDGKNRHDKLAPSMSSLILISHVKAGVDLAKKNKLGQAIIDTIQQHHGTSIITYFYEKAKQQKGEDAVKIDDFRYPGPKPQTREAGLVMLADIVEAASRTLHNPTPSRIQGLVQNLINKVFSDGQLDNCELTLRDLHSIAKSFNKILTGIHHHRVEYPESPAGVSNGKAKNGSPDRQPLRAVGGSAGKDKAGGGSRLKRLGIP